MDDQGGSEDFDGNRDVKSWALALVPLFRFKLSLVYAIRQSW